MIAARRGAPLSRRGGQRIEMPVLPLIGVLLAIFFALRHYLQ